MVRFAGIAIPSAGRFGEDVQLRTASCGDAFEGFQFFGVERDEHFILFAAASYIFVDRLTEKKSDPIEAAQFLQIGEKPVGYIHSDSQMPGGTRYETSSEGWMAETVFGRYPSASQRSLQSGVPLPHMPV